MQVAVADAVKGVYDAAARAPLLAVAGLASVGAAFYVFRRKGRRVCKISVPATTANLACGFDAFGAGFDFRMLVSAQLAPELQETNFSYEGEGANEVQLNETNLMWKSAIQCQKKYAPAKVMPKLKIHVVNPVPFGRGLGSSATAIVAGVYLANEFLELKLTKNELLDACLIIENHPDNLSAAIWGQGTSSVVSEDGKSLVRRFPLSSALQAVVVIPDFQVKTEDAREVLPKNYSRADVVFNMQRCGLLPLCLSDEKPDVAMIRECMKDKIHQNYRKPLMPGLDQVLSLPHGPDSEGWSSQHLVATALSGAGPTILALCTGDHNKIGKKMQEVLKKAGVTSKFLVLPFAHVGTTVSWS